MLSSAADQRRIAQTTHAEKLFRPETESGKGRAVCETCGTPSISVGEDL